MIRVGDVLQNLETKNFDLQLKMREDQLVRDKQYKLSNRVQNACILVSDGCNIDDTIGKVLIIERMMEKYND